MRPARSRAGAALAIACALALVAGSAPSQASPDRFDVVVVDAGHGGEDRGARGGGGLLEKELVLDIAQRLVQRLRARGLEVVTTRDGDVTVPLEKRTSIANDARGDLFISIHANSARSAKPSGTETYFASLEASDETARALAERENSAFGDAAARQLVPSDPLVELIGDLISNEQMKESSEFARLAQHALAGLRGTASRGVKQAPFVVLMGVQMPAVLLEIGFLSNGAEEKALRGGSRREAIARAIDEAVGEFAARYDAVRGVGPRAGLGR